MDLTEEMLDTAVQKAIEAGLLPRHACREDRHGQRELIRFVLQAALDSSSSLQSMKLHRQLARVRQGRFSADVA